MTSTMWLDDPNWQMSLLFVLAIALLGFVMKLVALLVPAARRKTDWKFLLSPLPAPDSVKRSPPWPGVWRWVLMIVPPVGALVAGYWGYWKLVHAFEIHGIVLSYLGAPFLLLFGYLLPPIITPLWSPGA